jgi:hypothetical protein
MASKCQNSKGAKVPQTFHKRSTNVLTSNRNDTRTSEFLPESAPSSTFLFGPGEQIMDQIEKICSQQDKFGNDTNTFGFVYKTILLFVLSFFTFVHTATVTLFQNFTSVSRPLKALLRTLRLLQGL